MTLWSDEEIKLTEGKTTYLIKGIACDAPNGETA
jgi:hypothetical protein